MIILQVLILANVWAADPNLGDPNMAANPAASTQGGLACPGFGKCPPLDASAANLGDNTNETSDSSKDSSKGLK